MVWPKRYKHEPPASRYFEGFSFLSFSLFACCGDGGLRATLFIDPSDPPPPSVFRGAERWGQRQVDHETNLNLGLK